MTTTTDIAALADVLADESLYPSTKGFREPSSPSFIFFDDHKEQDELTRWARELALDQEEWQAARTHWDEDTVPESILAYLERQEAREQANWLIGWHKRRPKNNDHWRSLIQPLIKNMDHPKLGADCITIIKALKEALPVAPGPIRNTVYVNPDGTRHEVASANIGAAKVGFARRHNLDDEFISVERVQKEGENFSRIVVGTRRTSDTTPSRYYDPNPKWSDRRINGKWVHSYMPSATNLYLFNSKSMVMPEGSHRLTVREFEQCVIAGAEIFENEDEAFANSLGDDIWDDRIIGMNLGYGSEARTFESLNEEEQFLYNLLRNAGQELACELLLLRNQEENCLATFFNSSDIEENPIDIKEAIEGDGQISQIIKTLSGIEAWEEKQFFIKETDQASGKVTRKMGIKMKMPKNSKIKLIINSIKPSMSHEWEKVKDQSEDAQKLKIDYGCNERFKD